MGEPFIRSSAGDRSLTRQRPGRVGSQSLDMCSALRLEAIRTGKRRIMPNPSGGFCMGTMQPAASAQSRGAVVELMWMAWLNDDAGGQDMSDIETLAGTVARSTTALREAGLRVIEHLRVNDPELANVLLDSFGTAEQAAWWLTSPHPLFRGMLPIELLAKERREEVMQVIRIIG
jgi:hypothetical protein